MPCLIGTAGHVDHGKTALIRALTGIETDRLPEEKARGVTIDIGYAFIDLPRTGRCSMVDVPGHERYATNMLVGSMGIDVGLLCISADEGPMPQTREHLTILSLLPVQHLVIALTKTDLVDAEFLEIIGQEIVEDLSTTRFAGCPIIPVSAHTGEGLAVLIEALDQAASEIRHPHSNPGEWYMPVDRSFISKGLGLIATGYLAKGTLHVGCEAEIIPGHHRAKVRSLQSHEVDVDIAAQGMRVAMNLTGVSQDLVTRGTVIAPPRVVTDSMMVDCKVQWVDQPKHAMDVRVALGTADAIGRLFLNDQDPSLAQIRFKEVVGVVKGQPVIIRRHSPPTLLAGGTVVIPESEIRRKKDVVRYVDLTNIEEGILAAIHEDPNGVPTQEICRLIGVGPQQLGDHFEQLIRERKVMSFAGIWYQPPIFLEQANKFLKALRELHEQSPSTLFIPRELVLKKTGRNWSGKPLERIIAKLSELGKIDIDGTKVKLKEFKIAMSPKQENFLRRIEAEMDKILINMPYPSEIASALGVPVQAVEEMLNTAANAGKLNKVSETLYYTNNQIARIQDEIRNITQGKPFTTSEIKEALHTSRKFIIPVLEHLDSIGFTQRLDDRRVIK